MCLIPNSSYKNSQFHGRVTIQYSDVSSDVQKGEKMG